MAKVYVYWNLQKNVWSLKYRGVVIAHANALEMVNCQFKVSPRGRDRVRKERCKNVHAFVVGDIQAAYGLHRTERGKALIKTGDDPLRGTAFWNGKYGGVTGLQKDAYYNPYITDWFQDAHDGKNIYTAHYVNLDDERHVTYQELRGG